MHFMPVSHVHVQVQSSSWQTLAVKNYSLSDRYSNTYVNDVFSDNILLTLAYMDGVTKNGQPVNWSKVDKNFIYKFVLQPKQTFAFHNEVLPQYKGKIAMTTNADFSFDQGFKSDGWLVGDGVCHLASFINVVARKGGLDVVAPTPHNFATIADVPRQFGVAIYYTQSNPDSSSLQNLYVTNPFDKPIALVFHHTGEKLQISVEKSS